MLKKARPPRNRQPVVRPAEARRQTLERAEQRVAEAEHADGEWAERYKVDCSQLLAIVREGDSCTTSGLF